jgi:hypothetical protein
MHSGVLSRSGLLRLVGGDWEDSSIPDARQAPERRLSAPDLAEMITPCSGPALAYVMHKTRHFIPSAEWEDSRQIRGLEGERTAIAYLVSCGWEIEAHRFRLGRHDIDLIARRGSMVAFVEVKTRRSAVHGTRWSLSGPGSSLPSPRWRLCGASALVGRRTSTASMWSRFKRREPVDIAWSTSRMRGGLGVAGFEHCFGLYSVLAWDRLPSVAKSVTF